MFALVDCNNFYCSCERVFRPDLQGKPIVVLSNNDGCAIARSEEAKALGIEMGAPYFTIRELVKRHNIHVFSSNYTLYGDMSSRVMETLQQFSTRVENYSIDEAFLDLSGHQPGRLEPLAASIRAEVRLATGIPVSIGLAPTKTLAKMANRFAKKQRASDGYYCTETKDEVTALLRWTTIGEVWGIGRNHRQMLNDAGITTAEDLLAMPEAWMRKHMTVVGLRLLNELKGIPCIPFEDLPADKEAICTSRSFGKLLTELEDIKTAVANFASACARKLREQKSCASVVQVFVQTNSFRKGDGQYHNAIPIYLPVATNLTQEIIFYALSGLQKIYRKGYNYMKAGVVVTRMVPEDKVQAGLFDTKDRFKGKFLVESMDGINRGLGRELVKHASQLGGDDWKMNRSFLSPSYTTRLDQVRKIKMD